MVRLGQGVDATGRLAEEALERAFAALDEYAALVTDHGVAPERIRFCATSATRDAANAAVFREGVLTRLGVEPEVLSGDEEAALGFAGALSGLPQDVATPVLVVDVGGGSTEVILGSRDGVTSAGKGQGRRPSHAGGRSGHDDDRHRGTPPVERLHASALLCSTSPALVPICVIGGTQGG